MTRALHESFHPDTPEWAVVLFERMIIKLNHLRRDIMADQDILDTDVAALTGVFTDIEAEVAALKATPTTPALDFTKLDALVASAKTADPGAPAVTPTPTTTPAPGA